MAHHSSQWKSTIIFTFPKIGKKSTRPLRFTNQDEHPLSARLCLQKIAKFNANAVYLFRLRFICDSAGGPLSMINLNHVAGHSKLIRGPHGP